MNRETFEYRWATTNDKASLWRANRLLHIKEHATTPTLVMHLINAAFPQEINLPTVLRSWIKPLAGFRTSTERPNHHGLVVRSSDGYLQVFRDTSIEYVNTSIARNERLIDRELFDEFLDTFTHAAAKAVPGEGRLFGLSLLNCKGHRLPVPTSRARADAEFEDHEIHSPLVAHDQGALSLRRFVWQAAGYYDCIENP